MSSSDLKILESALEAFTGIYSSDFEKEEAAKSIFKLLQERDNDPDIEDLQNAVGKSGVLECLWSMYKRRSSTVSEYVTLCLTWALFRNPLNSNLLGKRKDFGPTIKAVINDKESDGTDYPKRKAHAMDLWDNVVNNLESFNEDILDIIPCVVELMVTTKSEDVRGRCVNSTRISSYREGPRQRLRKTPIIKHLLSYLNTTKRHSRKHHPHAAVQVIANMVGDIPNHPALSACPSSGIANLVRCFERALEDRDYPEDSNTFPNDHFVCMGVANLANSDSMKEVLVGMGIFTLMQDALLKGLEEGSRLLISEALKCIERLTTVVKFALMLTERSDLAKLRGAMDDYKKITGDSKIKRYIRDIHANMAEAVRAQEEERRNQKQLSNAVKTSTRVICEMQMLGSDFANVTKMLEDSGYCLIRNKKLKVDSPKQSESYAYSFMNLLSKPWSGSSPAKAQPGGGMSGPRLRKRLRDDEFAAVAFQNTEQKTEDELVGAAMEIDFDESKEATHLKLNFVSLGHNLENLQFNIGKLAVMPDHIIKSGVGEQVLKGTPVKPRERDIQGLQKISPKLLRFLKEDGSSSNKI